MRLLQLLHIYGMGQKRPPTLPHLFPTNWGGKREYKNIFSDEPNAKLAIQLLPLNPTMKAYVDTFTGTVFKGTDVNKLYGDYIPWQKVIEII